MGTATLTLRKNELKSSISDNSLKKIKISNQRTRLSNFSSLLGRGITVSPTMIASVGSELFGDAIDSMGYAAIYASGVAQDQVDTYVNYFQSMTQDQYYNSGLGAEAALYVDENNNIIDDQAYEKFYKEAIKDYVNNYILPEITEMEKELEQEQTRLETLMSQQEAELQSIDQGIEKSIQRETIKF